MTAAAHDSATSAATGTLPPRLLEIDNLSVAFPTRSGPVFGVKGVTMNVGARERIGVVGESGSGKSVTALAALGLVQAPGRIVGGTVRWQGRDLFDPEVAAQVRGREIAMIFQDPMASLTALMSIERQICEVLTKRVGMSRHDARRRALELLELVGIANPKDRLKQFPFEFSGGMRQRVMIAIALAAEPKLLIADEPTTALDVTIQAQILALLKNLSEELDVAVMMITHDLGVVAEFCDRVQVMYAGRIVERSPVEPMFGAPLHPYSSGLISSSPRVDVVRDRLTSIPGDPAPHADAVPGCPFSVRCPEVGDRCRQENPPLIEVGNRRWVACWKRMPGNA
jgi:oligopeptide/dipeptide ABC transporter ATP-binding protein